METFLKFLLYSLASSAVLVSILLVLGIGVALAKLILDTWESR